MYDEKYWIEKRRQALDDPRTDQQVIEQALATDSDEHQYWDLVCILQDRGTPEVFDAARDLCYSSNPKARELGADVLAQGQAHWKSLRDSSVPLLLRMLETETNPRVLHSICSAFGHLDDSRCVQPVSRLCTHREKLVRYAVVHAMLGHQDPLAIRTLIELSADSEGVVRDWATFGLGTQIDIDTPEIREALFQRVDDPDDEARGEALHGLARRRDPRVVEPLLQDLSDLSTGTLAIEAARELRDPCLYPALLKHQADWGSNADASAYSRELLAEAIEACRPNE